MGPPYTFELARSLPLFDRSVSLLCWAFNEEESVAGYLVRADQLLRQTVREYEIIVIDDCSTDRTGQIVSELQKSLSGITLYRNSVNLNVGLSSQRAIAAATKEFVFWQTIDWAYDISMLRVHLELLKSYDMVAGVRRVPVQAADRSAPVRAILGLLGLFGIKHITRRSDTIPKALVSIINYLLIRGLFRVPLSDFQNVVFYPTHLIQSITFESRSSFSNPEALLKSYWLGHSIVEVPIAFIPRTVGDAKGTSFSAIRSSVTDIFRLCLRWMVLGRRRVAGGGAVRRLVPEEWGIL
jgi:hypothetical protein